MGNPIMGVRFPPQLLRRVKNAAALDHRAPSEWVRLVVEARLDGQEQPAPALPPGQHLEVLTEDEKAAIGIFRRLSERYPDGLAAILELAAMVLQHPNAEARVVEGVRLLEFAGRGGLWTGSSRPTPTRQRRAVRR